MHAGAAAALATEIDRIALCIHQPTGRRPDLMAALAPLGMPRRSIVVVAARFLAAGRLSFADLASMSRYELEEHVRRILDSHVRRGLLVDNGDDLFTPSQAFRSGAGLVLRLQSEEAERLWSSTSTLSGLTTLARAHVAAALESELPLDAFRRQTEVRDSVPQSDAGQLLAHVTELRYLRSDIHAQCLAEEGLSGPSARMLHRLWRGFEVDGELERTLIAADLVHGGSRTVTTRGQEVCEHVEAATNEHFARLFDALDDRQWTDLLRGLRALPGEDPRPAEDR
jgi:hypothetical protein